MNWLDPQAVREWLAQPPKYKDQPDWFNVTLKRDKLNRAWQQFGLAVANDTWVPTDNPTDAKWRSMKWETYREVARIIRDAEEGK